MEHRNLDLLRTRVLAAVIGAVLIAGVVTAVVRSSQGSAGSHPSAWEPRVAPIAHFVEDVRGLTFLHPVAVEFLPEAAFKARFAADKKPTAKEQGQLSDVVSTLRALGLIQGDVDLRAQSSQLLQTQVVGFYSPTTKRVYVRGAQLLPDVRETLAHELTHALQDQHFDLTRYDNAGSGVSEAYRALFEADAVRVQQAFDKTLPTDQQQALDLTRTQQARGANETTKQADAPEVLADEFEFPYAFGPAFVALLRRQGGNGALDAAFRRPPRSEAQIVDPQSYLSGAVVVHVAAPQLGPGETRLDKPYDVGQVSLLTVLGARLDYEVAWEAVRAWTGDQAVAYRQSGRVCVAVDTAMQTTPAADFFAKTATQWAASMPAAASAGSRRLSPTLVELRSCDPGKDATAVQPPKPSAFKVLATRSQIVAGALDDGASYALARCAAETIVAQLGPASMAALFDATDVNDPLVKRLSAAARKAGTVCVRSGFK